VFGLSNPCVIRDSSSLITSESLGVFGLSNPSVTPHSSSLMIYESLGAVCAVCAVESKRHPCQQLVDDMRVPRGCVGCRI